MRTSSDDRISDMTKRGWWGTDTLDDLFQRAVDSHPDQLALVDPFNREDVTDGTAQRYTFAELSVVADNLAADFYRSGLRQDDIVIVQLPNIAELAVLYLALGKLGVIISPVPMQYGRFELEKARDVVKPAAYISVARFKNKEFSSERAVVFDQSCAIFCFGDDVPEGTKPLRLSANASKDNSDYQAYIDSLALSANDIFTICWTSGTTGEPKGVPRSHNMWMASAIGAHDAASMQDNEILLNPFPLVNMAAIGGFLYCWMMRACALVLHHPFDMTAFLKQIQDERVAYTIAPPAILTMLLKKPEILASVDISSLRAIGSGSAPLSEFMVAGFGNDFGIDILNIFGSNEGICLASGPNEVPDFGERAQYFPRFGVERFEWTNRAGNSMKTRLVSLETGAEVTESGTSGELEIWGATLFDGYHLSAEANAEVFTEDGYFKTGDVFEIVGDRSQFYKYVGRCKDIIVRGGVNISPSEIDNVLAGHPKVADVCVVGLDDEILGERIGAVVVLKDGESITLEQLTDFLKERGLAVFKLPEKIVCADALPYNATGKLQRRDAKQFFEEQSD